MSRSRSRPRRLREGDVEGLALAYLARFSASRERVRQIVARRIARAAVAHDEDAAPLLAALEAALDKLAGQGLIDDARFAEAKTYALRRAGASRRRIAETLAGLGIAPELRAAALAEEESGREDEAELAAARAYARRRRLGPWRQGKPDPDRARKDMAALARAGFSLGVARQALGGGEDFVTDPEES